jgi:hypothetical protein
VEGGEGIRENAYMQNLTLGEYSKQNKVWVIEERTERKKLGTQDALVGCELGQPKIREDGSAFV